MSLLGYPGLCSATTHRNHCYFPVTSPVAHCSSDVNSTFGYYLPSNYQGNLWLLDHCQDSYCEAPCSESPSHEPKTCIPSSDSPNSSVLCSTPSAGQVVSACENTNIRPRVNSSPCTRTKGYVPNSSTIQYASKACQTPLNGSRCVGQLNFFPRNLQSLNHSGLNNFGFRSYQNLGFLTRGFSPSCYITSSYQPQSYLMRNCQYANYGSSSCRPLSYLYRSFQSRRCIPSTFPPLRYLCSSKRPLNCY
ncbi:keratin-associated protein 24-1 [Nannospalax galili]|uniref:keratin-associated protein 24-1 n=1 Tax=Nannospalax galili TaxID=1026970 RepID=UPI0004ED1058|nr:keratin-associated protein 24-1 [Nannospalax galili]